MHRNKSREEIALDFTFPWPGLSQIIVAFCPSPKGTGRRLIGIEQVLHINFFQRWFKLADPVAGFCQYFCQHSSKEHKPEPALHA